MEFEFKKNVESVCSSDVYYDLFDGGYLSPHDFLGDTDQVRKVMDAMMLIEDYIDALSDEGLLEEC